MGTPLLVTILNHRENISGSTRLVQLVNIFHCVHTLCYIIYICYIPYWPIVSTDSDSHPVVLGHKRRRRVTRKPGKRLRRVKEVGCVKPCVLLIKYDKTLCVLNPTYDTVKRLDYLEASYDEWVEVVARINDGKGGSGTCV